MNRHQRRAASKSPTKTGSTNQSAPETSSMTESNFSYQDINFTYASDTPVPPAKKSPGLMMRIFSGVLLSKFVLSRVKQPEVENLLMSVAIEANRQDVVDELSRRAATRSIEISL